MQKAVITVGRLQKMAVAVELVQNQQERAAAMQSKITKILLWLLVFINCQIHMASNSSLNAATIIADGVTEDFVFVMFIGDVNPGDDIVFNEKIQKFSNGIVIFSSNGGDLYSGLSIGESIRMKGFDTGVPPNSLCASACALAWLGGTTRYMSADSQIGFHAAYRQIDKQQIGMPNAQIGAYLTRLGIPKKAIEFMTEKGAYELNYLSINDAKNLGIKVKILELNESTTNSSKSITQANTQRQSYYYVTGLNPQGDNWLALKSQPDINSQRLRKLPPDTLLVVTGYNGKWFNVRLNDNTTGWVYSKYVACCKVVE